MVYTKASIYQAIRSVSKTIALNFMQKEKDNKNILQLLHECCVISMHVMLHFMVRKVIGTLIIVRLTSKHHEHPNKSFQSSQ